MSETTGTVTSIDGAYAIVETRRENGCGRCHETGGCGGANISRMMCSAPTQWRVLNPRGARVGEEVRIAVADGAVGAGALIVYVMPLGLLLAGAVLGTALFSEEGAIAGSLAGLLGGWVVMRNQQKRRLEDPRFQPHIL